MSNKEMSYLIMNLCFMDLISCLCNAMLHQSDQEGYLPKPVWFTASSWYFVDKILTQISSGYCLRTSRLHHLAVFCTEDSVIFITNLKRYSPEESRFLQPVCTTASSPHCLAAASFCCPHLAKSEYCRTLIIPFKKLFIAFDQWQILVLDSPLVALRCNYISF